ncbi:alpha/beta fold hydrolase [Gulosibacter chungangensis]|uniref:Alpha/beta hydrolase n=1 Tax=Gulosibacter chungangensis TaxID=979746 RepID=A0A7J5BAC5_9MICO|nr:alpha/beta hydrolase [Gulosibacter chungangensis]KAB1642719.1 alpha/beta hydrolase [Gulosibacter chungangensis]
MHEQNPQAVETAYLSIGESEMYSEVAGAGEPVLFLHGGFCSIESLRAQQDALLGDFRVFAFERPGHGRTADIEGDYHYARWLTDTLAYLDAQGLSDAHIVGYSDGAILGLLLAMAHPERVRSVVAIGANLDPSVFSDPSDEDALLSPPDDGEDKDGLERMHYARLSPDGPEHAQTVIDKLLRLWSSEPNIDPAELSRIHARTLIMAGDRDLIPPAHTLQIAAAIPGAQLCILPGTSHWLHAERPALVSQLIREFLLEERR